MDKEEGGWVKPRITHLLQIMEVPTEFYPGGSLVPVLLRKATPSLQLARRTCTCQFNIQRAHLPPGVSYDELKRCMTGDQRIDLIEEMTPIESSETPLLGKRKGRVYVGIFSIL
jgi:hypothetical protein